MGWRNLPTDDKPATDEDYPNRVLRKAGMTPKEIKAFRRKQRPGEWAATLLLLVAYLVTFAVYLLFLPVMIFRMLPCLYAKNIRRVPEGVVVYSLLGGEYSRHAWSEIEAFWIFDITYGFPPTRQWQLVLKDLRTIPLPLARGKTIWKICQSQGIPSNYWDHWTPEETAARTSGYLPGGRYFF